MPRGKPFAKGNTGRKKGALNKSISRERIKLILHDNSVWDRFVKDLHALPAKAYTETILKMLEWDCPKYSPQQMSLSSMSETDLQLFIAKIRSDLEGEQYE